VETSVTPFRPDFWITPVVISDHPGIEPFDEKVYATIYWLERMKDGKCTAGNKKLAEIIKPTDPQPRSVQNALDRLEKFGFIKREYKDASRRHRKKIKTLVSFMVQSEIDSLCIQSQSEMAMIPERILDDTQSETTMTRAITPEEKKLYPKSKNFQNEENDTPLNASEPWETPTGKHDPEAVRRGIEFAARKILEAGGSDRHPTVQLAIQKGIPLKKLIQQQTRV
jgi:hypothetical protein